MAEDLRSIRQFPHFHNFSATDSLTEIQLPQNCKRILVGCQQHALYIVQNGGADGATPGTHKGFIPKTNYLEVPIGIGLESVSSIYVCLQSGTGEISLILYED